MKVITSLNATEFSQDLDLKNIILEGNSLWIVNAVKTDG
jgi:hypothetical protein